MHPKRFLNTSLIVFLFTLTSCAIFPDTRSALEGTDWKLVSIGAIKPDPNRSPTLTFSGGRVTGSAGCNYFQGEYSSSRQKLEITDLAMTLIACPDEPGVMELEQEYFTALQGARSYELSGNRLSISTQDGTTLIFTIQ